MNLEEFQATLANDAPGNDWPRLLQAMWWDARADWEQAHSIAQDEESSDGSWVHAYLHRKEGDLGNASYWYRRAERPVFSGTMQEEWTLIVSELLPPS